MKPATKTSKTSRAGAEGATDAAEPRIIPVQMLPEVEWTPLVLPAKSADRIVKGTPPRWFFPGMVAVIFAFCLLGARAQESVYSGAFVHGEGGLNNATAWNTITNFETLAGKRLSIINYFSGWSSGSTNPSAAFNTTLVQNVRNHGSIPLYTWQPGGNDSFTLANIINGDYDAYITSWANAAKAWGHPFFLRFAHEMNGNWYTWSPGLNGNTAAQYIQMWRHVHDIFTRVGATNVTWVWCVSTDFSGSTPIQQVYPGDNYVDWLSLDSYNRLANAWGEFSERSESTLQQLMAIAPGKPIMVAETGCSEKAGHDKGQWLRNAMMDYLKNSMPRIKAWVYFNTTNQNDGNDWRIETSTNATAGYHDGITLSYYSANTYGAISQSPIQPLVNDAQATDTQPPFVSIVAPATSRVPMGTNVLVRAPASDKTGIARVIFSVNGVPRQTNNAAPYQYLWPVPAASGVTYTLSAQAFDNAGNSAASTIQVLALDGSVISLIASDALGTSSFNTAGNWSTNQPPVSGEDYYVGPGFVLRTPTDQTQPFTFAGDSLTIAGNFNFKMTNVITVNDLILNGGWIVNAFAGGNPNTARLDGNITVVTNGILDAGAVGQNLHVLAAIAGDGSLLVRKPSLVKFSAENSFSGPLTVAGTTLELDSTATLTPSSLVLQAVVETNGVTNAYVTNFVDAGGVLNVGQGGGQGVLRVGYRNSAGTNCFAVLDVSSQSDFAADVGEFSVGLNYFNDTFTSVGRVYLATNTVITATNILIADSTFSPGDTCLVALGGGSNYFHTPLLTVGGRKGKGLLTLPSGGMFQLDNNGGPADFSVANQNNNTGSNPSSTADLGGGTFVGNLGAVIVGLKAGGGAGGNAGTLVFSGSPANQVNANSVLLGSLAGASSGSAAAAGTLTFGGGNFTVTGNVVLGSLSGSGSAVGTLNLNGGTFTVGGNLLGGGGIGTVNVNGGTLVLSNQAALLTAVNLAGAQLHLNVKGVAQTNLAAATVSATGTSQIIVDSMRDISGAATVPLISYTGSSPIAGLTLGALPAGYTGALVDNVADHRIDLSLTPVAATAPLIQSSQLNGQNFSFQLNSQAGFDYVLEATPRLSPPAWTGVQTNPGGGALNFAIPVSATNAQRYFRIRVQPAVGP